MLLEEVGVVEGDEITCSPLLERIDIGLDILGTHAVLEHAECRLRITGTVEGLGIVQIDDGQTAGADVASVNLGNGLAHGGILRVFVLAYRY